LHRHRCARELRRRPRALGALGGGHAAHREEDGVRLDRAAPERARDRPAGLHHADLRVGRRPDRRVRLRRQARRALGGRRGRELPLARQLRPRGGPPGSQARRRGARAARAAALARAEPRAERGVPPRAGRHERRQPQAARLAGAPRDRHALPRERYGGLPVPGPGGVRPVGQQRQLRLARGAARRAAVGVEPVTRRGWLALATLGTLLACAEWAGPELAGGGPRLALVPVFSVTAGTVLFNDLDRLRVVVTGSGARAGVVVADTTVPVDTAGDATLTVP